MPRYPRKSVNPADVATVLSGWISMEVRTLVAIRMNPSTTEALQPNEGFEVLLTVFPARILLFYGLQKRSSLSSGPVADVCCCATK